MTKVLSLAILLVVLAILRAMILMLIIALPLALLVAAVLRPRQTLVFVFCICVLGLVSAQPVACIIAAGVIGAVGAASNAKLQCRGPSRPSDQANGT